jgi:Ohr subfamily peroxiredoxin
MIAGMKTLYTTSAVAMGDGRNGHVRTLDGQLDTPVRSPKELGGEGGATNYAACFHSALKLVAAKAKVDTTDSEVVVDVSLGALPHGGYGLAARIEVNLPGVDQATAERVVERAHRVCPYSNATRGNMDVVLSVA